MRKASLIACALLLWGGMLSAQSSDYIRFYPPAGIFTASGSQFFASGIGLGNTVADPYANLYGDAANTLALRNSTSAQIFYIYHTYTNTTNYERGRLKWNANVLEIGTTDEDAGGTGTARTTAIVSGATGLLKQGVTTIANWDTLGFYPGATDTYSSGYSTLPWTHGYFSRSIQGSKSKTLTDAAAAVSFVRIAVATNGYIGGKVIATANSTDGTNRLTTTSEWYFAGADTGGTVTCGAPSAVGTPATAYRRANTLVCTMTSVTSTTNCDLQITCTDNLAGDQTPVFEWRLDMPSTATVTPQ